MPATRDNGGFTLLELIIALTITAMIGVIILGAFRIGIRAWEKGEKDTGKHQRQRIVLNLIREQIIAISLRKIRNNGKAPFFLKGDQQNLELISRRSLMNADRDGLVHVRYAVSAQDAGRGGHERLLYLEKKTIWMDESADEIPSEEDFYELIPDAHRITFEYLGRSGIEEELNWLPDWNQEQNSGFPRAVRISLTPEADQPSVNVIARIEAELSS